MVTSLSISLSRSRDCPHCSGGYLMWDERDHEPYCFNCGWRSYTVINQEQAKARVKWSSWVKLLASKVNYSDGFNSRLTWRN